MPVLRGAALVVTEFKAIGGKERGLVTVNDKPLMEYVLESIPDEVEEVVISVSGEKEANAYSEIAEKHFARLRISQHAGLATDVAGLMEEGGFEQLLVLPCDAPLISRDFTSFLLETTKRFSAAIPRSSGTIPLYLFSSYRSDEFLNSYKSSERKAMDEVVNKMRNVLYVNLNALKIFDEKLYMFTRVACTEDIRRVERIIKTRL